MPVVRKFAHGRSGRVPADCKFARRVLGHAAVPDWPWAPPLHEFSRRYAPRYARVQADLQGLCQCPALTERVTTTVHWSAEVPIVDLDKLPLLLTVEEAAKVMRISRTGAYNAVAEGVVPAIRIGRTIRIPRDRLVATLGLAGPPAERSQFSRE